METAIAVLSTAVVVDLASFAALLSRLPPREAMVEAAFVAALILMVAFLLWRTSRRARWALVALTGLLVVSEVPNALDVVTGGIDQPVGELDLALELVEALLCLIGLVLLWGGPSRNWFFNRARLARPASAAGTAVASQPPTTAREVL